MTGPTPLLLNVDVAGPWLVIAATGDPAVDDLVQRAADAAGVWVTRADRRDGGGAAFAATLDRGPVTIGVITGSVSPTLATWVRDRIAAGCRWTMRSPR